MIKEYKKKLQIFKYGYSVIVYDKPKELRKRFKKETFEQDLKEFDGCFMLIKDKPIIAIMRHKKLTPGVIAHECKHFVNYIMDYHGAELSTRNDEFECYLLGHVVDEVHKHIDLK